MYAADSVGERTVRAGAARLCSLITDVAVIELRRHARHRHRGENLLWAASNFPAGVPGSGLTRSVMHSAKPPRSQISFALQVICFCVLLGSADTVVAAENRQEAASSAISFDIPALPLGTALDRFMSVTNVAVFVDSAVIAGRTSTALQGYLSPDGALRSLLTGTGLDPQPIGSGAYTLVQLTHPPEIQPLPRFADYAAALQKMVTAALCRRDDTRPTHYRMVIRLWLNPAGAVTRVELGSSTGDPGLDLAIGDALRHIDIEMPAPAGLPQPVKLAIMPLTTGDAACPPVVTDGQPMPVLDR